MVAKAIGDMEIIGKNVVGNYGNSCICGIKGSRSGRGRSDRSNRSNRSSSGSRGCSGVCNICVVYVALCCYAVSYSGNTLYAQDMADREKAMARIVLLLEETIEEAFSNSIAGEEHQSADNSGMQELYDMAVEHFERLLEHPLQINGASRKELEEFVLLSDFQIESILDYRRTGGDILSCTELSLLNGFDAPFAEDIAPFVSFAPSSGIPHYKNGTGNFFKECKSQIYFRTARDLKPGIMYSPVSDKEFEKNPNCRYLGTPYYLLLKYKCTYSNKLQAGITFENDAGERLFTSGAPPVDFFSFHIAAKNVGRVNTLIIGDYSARFGQGLVLWNSFSQQGASSPMALYKRGAVFVPYTSSGESGFYRGAALSVSLGKIDVSAMFSCNMRDARIAGNEYVSLVAGGIHNTVGTVQTRKRMAETLGGVGFSYMLSRLKIGISCIAYGYNKKNGRKIYEYNRLQMYDGLWGNISADFYTIIRRVKLFGEFAFDYGGSMAMLAGAVFDISEKLEMGCLLRCYSKSYIAPHASAYSTISSVSNQRGLALNGVYALSSLWKISFGADAVCYPWSRYNIKGASGQIKGYALAEYSTDRMLVKARLSDTYTTHNRLNKLYFKIQSYIPVTDILSVKPNVSVVYATCPNYKTDSANYGCYIHSFGWQTGANIKYESPGRKFSVQAGGCMFSCNDWNSRLYVYEADLPYTYNSRLLYGKGYSLYTMVKLKAFGLAEVCLKYETTQYSASLKEPENKIKMAVKCSF